MSVVNCSEIKLVCCCCSWNVFEFNSKSNSKIFSNQILYHEFLRNIMFYLNIIIWYFVILCLQKNDAVYVYNTLTPNKKNKKIFFCPNITVKDICTLLLHHFLQNYSHCKYVQVTFSCCKKQRCFSTNCKPSYINES